MPIDIQALELDAIKSAQLLADVLAQTMTSHYMRLPQDVAKYEYDLALSGDVHLLSKWELETVYWLYQFWKKYHSAYNLWSWDFVHAVMKNIDAPGRLRLGIGPYV